MVSYHICHSYYFNLDLMKNHLHGIKENYWFQETNKESDIAASEYFIVKIEEECVLYLKILYFI